MNRGPAARWLRLGGVLVVLGAVTIGPAAADNGTDQITGNGETPSAITTHWSDGLLSSDNQTATPRDQGSSLKFMYPDFQNLAVTVGQTKNLVHQAIKVTWSGFFSGGTNGGYLQMMQCYGDSSAGPGPEDCQYGSSGLLSLGGSAGASVAPAGIGSRSGNLCAPHSVASASNPPSLIDGSSPGLGCDTLEPTDPSHLQPGTNGQSYNVPFVPVNAPTQKIYGAATDYYDQFNTNEVQHAATGQDGTGQYFFQTLTGTQAPGLGCGATEDSGQPRDCWLVIVPRGQYLANGVKLQPNGFPTDLSDSPLGASNWAQRIQIHLGFDPIQAVCPIGSATERQMVGTQLAGRAVFSWQLALNSAANCQTLYAFTAAPEATATTQLSDTSGRAAGAAFTTIPIGGEQTRSTGGGPVDIGVPLVYAPMAVSAVTIAFNVNLQSTGGFYGTPIRLTPRLLAKALTQSYREDLPDFDGANPGPDWSQRNPLNIIFDPEFKKLNPQIQDNTGSGAPKAPLITEDHSGVNQQVWQWIDSDPAARKWLEGSPDENGMKVNPEYQKINLGNTAIDSYPRADSTCFNTGTTQSPEVRCSLDLLPYTENLDTGAAAVRSANNPEGAAWDNTALSPSGTAGWWGKGGIEPVNSTFMWTITSTDSLSSYGLVPAQLCDGSGNNCVGASTASVTAALNNAKPDSTGILHINPAAAGSGGYPLVDVSYAAVRANQPPDALTDFARLVSYAAGVGQTPGVDPGQLPRGYLPLPDSLKAQAQAAAATLLADANPQQQPNNNSSGTQSGSGGGQPNNSGTPNTTQPGNNSPSGNDNGSGKQGNTKAAGANPLIGQTPKLAAKTTPSTPLGGVRWVLLVALIVGVVGGLSGPLVRNPSWPLEQWRRIRR